MRCWRRVNRTFDTGRPGTRSRPWGPRVEKLRLIIDPPRQAALNMAIDEMLMSAQAEEGTGPVLRFYRWEEPSITSGYFQKIEQVAKRFDAYRKGIPLARCLSGGGAVLHGEDLTFSLCLSVPNPYFPTDVKSSYLKINEAVRTGLKSDYPEIDYTDCRTVPSGKSQSRERICFDSPACYDLLWNGRKILGASQRRIGRHFLHQATLFLNADKDFLTKLILRGFETTWKVSFEERALGEEELDRARRIEETRYASPDWALLRERSFFS